MKHPGLGQFHIDAFTDVTREEARMMAEIAPAYDFYEMPSAESFRQFLVDALNDHVAWTVEGARASAEEIHEGADEAVSPDDALFETPFVTADLLEKVEALSEEKILVLFGYLLGLHYGPVE